MMYLILETYYGQSRPVSLFKDMDKAIAAAEARAAQVMAKRVPEYEGNARFRFYRNDGPYIIELYEMVVT